MVLAIIIIINSCIDDDDLVKQECGWILYNIITRDDPEMIHFLVEKGVINGLKFVMKICTSSKTKLLINMIDSFCIICNYGKNGINYKTKIEKAGCCEVFAVLQAGVDSKDEVYIAAEAIMTKYWPYN